MMSGALIMTKKYNRVCDAFGRLSDEEVRSEVLDVNKICHLH